MHRSRTLLLGMQCSSSVYLKELEIRKSTWTIDGQSMLPPLNELHSGTVFHQNILNRARFYQRVELGDRDSKGQTSLEKAMTLFCTEALNHKFGILAEKAKNSEDLRLHVLEGCQAFKWLLSVEDAAALSGLVKGCLNALSSASGGRGRTSSNGPSSSHPTSHQLFLSALLRPAKPVNVMRYF